MSSNLTGFSSNNQKIRSLAEQASIYCINGHFKAPWTYEDKFAELIIRKCAEIALQEQHEPSECILKYFGLE